MKKLSLVLPQKSAVSNLSATPSILAGVNLQSKLPENVDQINKSSFSRDFLLSLNVVAGLKPS